MRIYPKIYISINASVNTSDRSLQDMPSIVTKAPTNIFSSFRAISTGFIVEEDTEEEGECEEC